MNGTNVNIKYALYALLLYIPTIAHMRAELFLLAIGAVVFFERKPLLEEFKAFRAYPFARKYLVTVWLVLTILIASIVNKMVFGNEILCLRDYYAPFFLFPLLILVARYFGKPEVFKFLLLLTVIEIGVACIQYGIGTRSFLVDLGDLNSITNRSLLYESRCFGLSGNSSILANKVLIAALLIEYVRFSKAITWILRIVILLGVLLSFSRSVVIVMLLFWTVLALRGLYLGWKNRQVYKSVGFQFNLLMLALILVFNSGIRNQLARGGHEAETVFGEKSMHEKLEPTSCAEIHAIEYRQGELDPAKQGWGEKMMIRAEGVQSSGRKLIWVNYLNFIEDNLIVGNGSDKVMLRSWQNVTGKYKLIHAHNSYLMLIAANGLLIAALYLLFYLLNFKSRNFLAILCILVYSALNYGIFWGFSYLDAVFIILLTLKFKNSYDYAREN